jgi:hypothetical protein
MIIEYENGYRQKLKKYQAIVCLIGTVPTSISDITADIAVDHLAIRRYLRTAKLRYRLRSLRINNETNSVEMGSKDLLKLRRLFSLDIHDALIGNLVTRVTRATDGGKEKK